MQQESQSIPTFARSSFQPSSMRMSLKTLTHDYYMLELPLDKTNKFFKHFPFYLEQKDHKGNLINVAPVARIYGTNQFGQKCCCNIHGYFPYFYIKASEYSNVFKSEQFLNNFISTLQSLYQRAYIINKPIIINAHIQQKIDFYGYHNSRETFVKIYVYDPVYIAKLRQLLDSGIMGGKFFQCYQAHINYFMQLFSDHNIFGIDQLKIIQFTFRKNLNHEVMQLFRKISSLTGNIITEGINVSELESKFPHHFNILEKTSSSYIEVDIHMNNILNTFSMQNQIANSQQEKSVDSDDIIEECDEHRLKNKFVAKITRSLEQIWKDQELRRQKQGSSQKLVGYLDFSKNVQGKNFTQGTNIDPLWISFLKKGNNLSQFTQLIRSSQRGEQQAQMNTIQVQRYVAENYNDVLQGQRQKLIEKVKARWKYYGDRKNTTLEQILSGEREELPEWEDDRQSSCSDSEKDNLREEEEFMKNQNSQEELSIRNKVKTEVPKKKNATNTALYRGNYKHLRAQLQRNSFFYICEFCKTVARNCKCQKTESILINSEVQKLAVQNFINDCERAEDSQKIIMKFKYKVCPPTTEQAISDSKITPQKPYYSNLKDLFTYHKINPLFIPCLKFAQILDRELKKVKHYNRQPITIKNQLKLPDYFRINAVLDDEEMIEIPYVDRSYRVKYEELAPSYEQVLEESKNSSAHYKINTNRRSTSVKISKQDSFLTDLVVFNYQFLTCFDQGSQRYCSDPEKDEIICFSFQTRNFLEYRKSFNGLIMIDKYVSKESLQVWMYDDIFFVKNQYHLLSMIISIICRIDPDFLVTFDQEKRGIRYLTQRGFVNGINFQSLISRSCELDEIFEFMNFKDFQCIKTTFLTKDILLRGNILVNKVNNKKSPQLAFLEQKLKNSLKRKPVLREKYRFDIEIKGRVNINLYRICQAQLKLKSYTIESVCKHLFDEQICEFTDKDLYLFYKASNKREGIQTQGHKRKIEEGVNFVVEYLNRRLNLFAQIIVSMNIVSVLVEKSKIYGSDIVSMMERGSQFKIEAVMCRVVKKLGYLTLSASKRQVGNQSVLECIPFVLEPPKQFYSDPVLVFDFQSLYPSVMIAYNICYSTCLGSINSLFDRQKNKKIGVCQKMNIEMKYFEELLRQCETEEEFHRKLQKSVFITPNKVAYVKKNMRQGILPRILLEFLVTRIMVKNSESRDYKNRVKKMLKDRQYALKLFMNVMFGYTGASFTGRMPCSQIADSIVQTSKYLLKQSIDYLNNHKKYKGNVVYGDTDSVFFNLPGYSIKDSLKIGQQLAQQITGLFPYPIQMKFEKSYDGLFLVAKKRYYGKMYESEKSQAKYEGKGLECIRRDGIKLTSDLMRQMLNKLIDTRDLSILKALLKKEYSQIMNNQKLESEFVLAKEVKLMKYTDKTCPAHGEAAKRLQKIDPMLSVKYGQRLKYFVINGGLKPIKSRSIAVFQFLMNKNMSLDMQYYFRKQILPPVQRVLASLADLNQWTASTEYKHKFEFSQSHKLQLNKKCYRCDGESAFVLCESCFPYIEEQEKKIKEMIDYNIQVCMQCTGSKEVAEQDKCMEFNCSHLWKRRAGNKLQKNLSLELQKLQQAIKALNL